jgi:hypothetical protein
MRGSIFYFLACLQFADVVLLLDVVVEIEVSLAKIFCKDPRVCSR